LCYFSAATKNLPPFEIKADLRREFREAEYIHLPVRRDGNLRFVVLEFSAPLVAKNVFESRKGNCYIWGRQLFLSYSTRVQRRKWQEMKKNLETLLVTNLPVWIAEEELREKLIGVDHVELVDRNDQEVSRDAIVTFESARDARIAYEYLKISTVDGHRIEIDYLNEKTVSRNTN
jgi:hypothetical protein